EYSAPSSKSVVVDAHPQHGVHFVAPFELVEKPNEPPCTDTPRLLLLALRNTRTGAPVLVLA
ncbi:hypothetical protein Tco_0737255, partial [Tanacetum coccineum]